MEMQTEASLHPALQGMKVVTRAEKPFVPSQYSSRTVAELFKNVGLSIVPLRT